MDAFFNKKTKLVFTIVFATAFVLAVKWMVTALALWLIAPYFGFEWSVPCVTGVWMIVMLLDNNGIKLDFKS